MVACAPTQPPADTDAELDALVRAAELDALARLRKLVNSADDAIATRAATALLRYAGERRRAVARVAAAALRADGHGAKPAARVELAEVESLARTLLPTRGGTPVRRATDLSPRAAPEG